MPVLESHLWYGVTAAMKHYMGVLSEETAGGLTNGHYTVGKGGLGTLMVETGIPTLNIIDAIWVNANPAPGNLAGPGTPYGYATRVNVLLASTDPVALDYWAAKNVLKRASGLIGYNDTHTLDPDSNNRTGVSEAFGVWLNRSKTELLATGYNVTTDENRMNVYVLGVHDLAVSGVAVSETLVARGATVNISVAVQNVGDMNETFNLTIYANALPIHAEMISLASKNTTTLDFAWNTASVSKGDYVISACAEPVPHETKTADNVKVSSTVTVVSAGHDVCVSAVSTSKTVAGQGYCLTINVTTRNVGLFTEDWSTTVYANETSISHQNVTLQSGNSATLTFVWNTASYVKGNYTVNASATILPDEVDEADNYFSGGWVYVGVPGDVDGNRIVNMLDLYIAAIHFGQT